MPRGPSLTDWQILEGLNLRALGWTPEQIAADLGRSPQCWYARFKAIDAECG